MNERVSACAVGRVGQRRPEYRHRSSPTGEVFCAPACLRGCEARSYYWPRRQLLILPIEELSTAPFPQTRFIVCETVPSKWADVFDTTPSVKACCTYRLHMR